MPQQVADFIAWLRTQEEIVRHDALLELHAEFCQYCGSDEGSSCHCCNDE
jgi:hypothetical protein